MIDTTLDQELLEEIRKLDVEEKRQALDYVRSLTRPKGISGKEFIERTRDIHIDPEDLKLMEEAIEEWCERIDDFPELNFDE